MDEKQESKLMAGYEVLAKGGQGIGTVASVQGDAFRVVTPEGDLWLNRNCIFQIDGKHVMLVCESADIEGRRIEAPAVA